MLGLPLLPWKFRKTLRYEETFDYTRTERQIVQIKSIVLGEYAKGFLGYKNIVIPSLIVQNIETNEVFDIVKFYEWRFQNKPHHPSYLGAPNIYFFFLLYVIK